MNSADNQRPQIQNCYHTNQSNIQNTITQNLNPQKPINFQSQAQSEPQSQMFQSNQYNIHQQQQQARLVNQYPQILPSRQISSQNILSQPMYPPNAYNTSYSNDQQNPQQMAYNSAFQNQNIRPATPNSFNNQSMNIPAYNLDKPQLQSVLQPQLPLHIQNQTQNNMGYSNPNIPRPMLYQPSIQYQSRDGSIINRMGLNMIPYPEQSIYPPVRSIPQQQQQLHYSKSNPNLCYQQQHYQQQIQYQQPFYQQPNQNQNQNQNQMNYQQSQQIQSSSSLSSSLSTSSTSTTYNVVRTAVPWSEEESILLMKLRDRGLTWKEIASHFTNRTLNACQFRWKRISLNGGIEFESNQNNSEIDNNNENSQKQSNEEEEEEDEDDDNDQNDQKQLDNKKYSIVQKEASKDDSYSKNEENKIDENTKNEVNKIEEQKIEQKDSKINEEEKENIIVNPENNKEVDEQKASIIHEKEKNDKEDSNIEDESTNEKKLHGLKRNLDTKEKNTQKYKFKKMKIKNSNKIDNLLNSTLEVKKITDGNEKREIEWVSNNSSINIKPSELKPHNSN